jgi:hypothetical protein
MDIQKAGKPKEGTVRVPFQEFGWNTITEPEFPPLKSVLALLPKTTSLYYVDCGDSLDGSMDKIQKCITNQDWEALDGIFEGWDNWHNVKYHIDELKSDVEREFDVEDGQDIMDKYEDWIRDAIYERDDSTPLDDLFRNTGSESVFYDTGEYIEADSWAWDARTMNENLGVVKKTLGVRGKDHDDDIRMMLRQASYGGQLVIYFPSDMQELIIIDKKFNAVEFDDPMIAVINTSNGSGDNCGLDGVTITLPLNRENFFIDRTVSYSYVHEVCGMCSDWCNGSSMAFKTIEAIEGEVGTSAINAHMKREAELNKIYKEGGCTFGDINYTRHRNTTYINDFPCGTKCKDCTTFWID